MMHHTPQRIVCLTPETADVLYRIGGADRVVGVSCYAPPPPDGRKRPVVSVFTTVKYDAIDALGPDLVIAFSDLQAEAAHELGRRGHQVLLTNQRTLAGLYQMIAMVGSVAGCGEGAARLIDSLRNGHEQIEREARDALEACGHAPPVVYFEEWDEPLITGIAWVGEMIEAAGGRDAFDHLRHRPSAGQRIIQPADVVERQPDIILASWCGKRVRPQAITERPGWSDLPALRNDQVHEIPSASCLQPGPALIEKGLPLIRRIIHRWQVIRSSPSLPTR